MRKEILQTTHIRLSKVILLRDAFSEETVTNGVRLRVSGGGRKPVMKPGGYWLFLDMGMEEFEIEMESPIYQRRRILLKPDQGEEAEEIFLYPSGAYPVRSGYTMLKGTARPGTVIHFHLEDGMPEGRLIHDCEKGDQELSVFIRNVTGTWRKWYIWDKEQETGEYIQIRDFSEDSGKCGLTEPLKNGYRKKNTVIFRACESAADDDGRFFLLLAHPKDQKMILCYSYLDQTKEFHRKMEFAYGDRKQINIGEDD